MNKKVLDILACPVCKGSITYDKKNNEIICPRCHLAYPIIQDMPVMRQSKARPIPADELA